MRGLPFNCTESDIMNFFAPLEPYNIVFLVSEKDNRRTGECECNFISHNDACEAMKNDNKFMGLLEMMFLLDYLILF